MPTKRNGLKFLKNLTLFLVLTPLCDRALATAEAASINGTSYGLVATPLGDGYSLTTESTGYTTAVTSADGSQTYQFDKFPVFHNMIQITPDPNHDPIVEHSMIYEVMQNKYGTVSINYERYGSNTDPLGDSVVNGWYAPGLVSPAKDFNIHGVVVGQTGVGPTSLAGSTSFGYLQNDFPAMPGLAFNSSLYVDDSGQIIVAGTLNGKPQDFLVTQGQPLLAPEPSTIAILACSMLALGARQRWARSRLGS